MTLLPLVTVTVILFEDDPAAFEAVSVYSVVVIGLTVMLTPVTAPMPGLILKVLAPLTLQLNTLDSPGEMLLGCAVKEPVGGLGGVASCVEAVYTPVSLRVIPESDVRRGGPLPLANSSAKAGMVAALKTQTVNVPIAIIASKNLI